jgi:hypothetical protein
MVESICGQSFAYTHEVEEERLRKLIKLGKRATGDKQERLSSSSKIRST